MGKIKYTSKQWSVTLRDFLKSLFYGAVVPALVTIQGIIEAGGFTNLNWKLILQISVGSIIAHLVRKLAEPTKEVQIVKLSTDGNGNTNPPPVGDPTHPKKPNPNTPPT